MDIAIVTMQLGAGYRHGTERYVETLGSCLRRRGHRVDFVAGDPQGFRGSAGFGELVDAALGLHAHPTQGWMAVTGACRAEAERWLAQRQPDVVHLANPATRDSARRHHDGLLVGLPARDAASKWRPAL